MLVLVIGSGITFLLLGLAAAGSEARPRLQANVDSSGGGVGVRVYVVGLPGPADSLDEA